jgi:hypothetical protein
MVIDFLNKKITKYYKAPESTISWIFTDKEKTTEFNLGDKRHSLNYHEDKEKGVEKWKFYFEKDVKEFIRLSSEKPTFEQVQEFNNLHRKSDFESSAEWERHFFIWRLNKLAGDKLK